MKTVIQVGTRVFDYADPLAFVPNLKDDVAAIAKINRFGGRTTRFYSVAQHCVLVSCLCQNRPWDGLAHDLGEAYYGDIPTPLKNIMRQMAPQFMERLKQIDWMVENAYGFDPHAEEVKKADLIALATERKLFLPASAEAEPHWEGMPKDLGIPINPLSPEEAEKAWWRRFDQLAERGLLPKL